MKKMLCGWVILPLLVQAADNSWVNTTGGAWETGGNWSLSVAPSYNANVYINNASSKTVTISAATPAANLTITNLLVEAANGATNTLLLSGNTAPLTCLGFNPAVNIGKNAGTVGALVLDNGMLAHTNSTDGSSLYLGYDGLGVMTVNSGTWLGNKLYLGYRAGGQGRLSLIDGTYTFNGSQWYVGTGPGGTGEVWMTDGLLTTANATTNCYSIVGNQGVGTMTVSGGRWIGNDLGVGVQATGNGTLFLAGGTNSFGGSLSPVLRLGSTAGSTGTVWLTGGLLVTTNAASKAAFNIGVAGVGNMTVSNGMWVADTVYLGNGGTGAGTLTLAGGTNLFKSADTYGLQVGVTAGGRGTVVMTGGLLATTNAAGNMQSAIGYSGAGDMTVSDGTWRGNSMGVGVNAGSSGKLQLLGSDNTFDGTFTVGNTAGSTGTVMMTGGSLVTTNAAAQHNFRLGYNGQGTMTVSNGTWLANGIYVGWQSGSQGTLNLAGGTNVFSYQFNIPGAAATATGIVNLTGGLLVTTNTAGNLAGSVGNGGVGSMTVSGGRWLGNMLYVSQNATGQGKLYLTGGTSTFFATGHRIGSYVNTRGYVWLTGGQFETTNVTGNAEFYLGYTGCGTMTVSNGNWLANTIKLGNNPSSTNNLLLITGGQVAASVGVNTVTSNNTVLVTGGGVLEANSLTITANSFGNVISNTGGVYQFSKYNPTITPASGSIVVDGGAISFRGIANANVKENWTGTLKSMTFLGNNAFRLNAATNATTPDQSYTFDTGLGSTNYTRLELVNGSQFRGGNVTIGGGGSLMVSNGVSTIGGNLTLQNGSSLEVTVGGSGDSLVVEGTASLSGATLQVTLNTDPTLLYPITIIRTAGLSGSFPSPVVASYGGKDYSIAVRSSGNNIVLDESLRGTLISVR